MTFRQIRQTVMILAMIFIIHTHCFGHSMTGGHCKGPLQWYCLGIVSLLSHYRVDTVLELSWYCLGTVSVLSRYCLSTVALLLQYCRGTVLILSRYCLDTGYCLNTVSVLLRYCLGAVLVLSRYCLDTVAALCRYCLGTVPVLSRYCMDSVSGLPRYYLDTVLVLPWYCLGIVAVLFQCCQGNVLILRGSARYCSFTEILDSWCLLGIYLECKHFSEIIMVQLNQLPLFHQYYSGVEEKIITGKSQYLKEMYFDILNPVPHLIHHQ